MTSQMPADPEADASPGKVIVVVDDDSPALEGMGGLLRSWGYRVVTASTEADALSSLAEQDRIPDLIISDYRLQNGKTGIDVIARLRSECSNAIPAFIVSGDTDPGPLRHAQDHGLHLIHKPVDPMTLRAMLNRMMMSNAPRFRH